MRVPRYPRIPYLAPAPSIASDDSLLSSTERQRLLSGPVTVEEKLDGSNVWISFDSEGRPHAGGRSGSERSDRAGQLGMLRSWMFERAHRLAEALPSNSILYGEWLRVTHSVHYDRLPDYFIAVDVLLDDGSFVDRSRREQICAAAELSLAPLLYQGTLGSFEALKALHHRSAYSSEPAEGLIARREAGGRTLERAKWVHAGFRRKTDDEWQAADQRQNELASGRGARWTPDSNRRPKLL